MRFVRPRARRTPVVRAGRPIEDRMRVMRKKVGGGIVDIEGGGFV